MALLTDPFILIEHRLTRLEILMMILALANGANLVGMATGAHL